MASSGILSTEAVADQHGLLGDHQVFTKQYFPFVPNGEMIGGTGPWYGSISVQNLENAPVHVWVGPVGPFDPADYFGFAVLAGKASTTFSIQSLGIAAPGAPVAVHAVRSSVWQARGSASLINSVAEDGLLNGPNVVATLKQSSPNPLQHGTWSAQWHHSVDGYAAIPEADAGWGELSASCADRVDDLNRCPHVDLVPGADGHSYLPIAQTNNAWNTILYVTNVEASVDEETDVGVELVPMDGSGGEGWVGSQPLEPGETWKIDVQALVGTEWVGSVRIHSEAGVIATAARHKASTRMLLTNTSVATMQADSRHGYRLIAPLTYIKYLGWNTGFSMSNQSDQENRIRVRFFDVDGNQVDQADHTIAPHGQEILYLPSMVNSGALDGWIGSVILESRDGRPFTAAVDQVNYSSGAAMSYVLGSRGTTASSATYPIGLPLLQKGDESGQAGDGTGIQLFNADASQSVQVAVSVYSRDGFLVSPGNNEPLQVEIGPRGSATVYTPNLPWIPEEFTGSAMVEVIGGGGQVFGVANTVNYHVDGDGAVAFPLNAGRVSR
jgi:hypothetical protein